MTAMEMLRKEAKVLEAHLDTEWAEENKARYDAFAETMEREWAAGNITDRDFNELALTAFYDWPDDLKGNMAYLD